MREQPIRSRALLSAAFLAIAACGTADGRVALTVGDTSLWVELADTPDLRERGLMHRESLDEDAGMLFVFNDEEQRVFWMKNTSIPLSIAYISADGTINEIHDMVPFSLEPVRSRFPAAYALEVNRGWFERRGVSVGDRITLPDRQDR